MAVTGVEIGDVWAVEVLELDAGDDCDEMEIGWVGSCGAS
jgi:hypothetical protein